MLQVPRNALQSSLPPLFARFPILCNGYKSDSDGAEHMRWNVGVIPPGLFPEHHETTSSLGASMIKLTSPFLSSLFLWNQLLKFKTPAGTNNYDLKRNYLLEKCFFPPSKHSTSLHCPPSQFIYCKGAQVQCPAKFSIKSASLLP